ncbi:hypothetical protein KWE80_14820 [Acinetobacter pittii]|uniref:hypothetical protein n=1 Tax=Acinetobacter pittii TaxID=48296 RepID=UPI00355AEA4C
MAVPDQTPYKEYVANGTTTIFPLEFDVLQQDHLIVLVNDAEPSVGSWSLDSINDTVIFNVAPLSGSIIKIRRDTPLQRTTDYATYNNSFRADPVNLDFDNIWRKLQEMGVLNWMIDNNIKDLNEYVDSLNDETKAIFLQMIKDQGTSLEQLDTYVDQLYKNLANVAIEKGWLAEFIADGDENQKIINDETTRNFDSIADLLQYNPRRNGQTVYVKSYYAGWANTYPYLGPCGGGTFVYNSDRINENDGVLVFNGWIRHFKNSKISVHDAGARGDYNETTSTGTDDGPAFQRALIASGMLTGQQGNRAWTVEADATKNYYISTPFMITNRTILNLNGASLFGNNRLNDCIRTGYWKNGVLTDLTSAPLETQHLFNVVIKNGRFRKFKNSLNVRGLTKGCKLISLDSNDCDGHISSIEHYFLSVINNAATNCTTGYAFSVYSGMLNFSCTSALSCTTGFVFSTGAQAISIRGISCESCVTGVSFTGASAETGGITIQGYFENVSGTVIDCKGIGQVGSTVTMVNSFVNCPTANLFDITGSNAQPCFNEDYNQLRAIGKIIFKSDTATLNLSKTNQKMVRFNGGSSAPNSVNGTNNDKNSYPANDPLYCLNTQEQIVSQVSTTNGKVQAIHRHFFNVVPANYYGYQGEPVTNVVPFCSHVGVDTSAGTPQFKIELTTSIKNHAYTTGLFNLVIFHNSGVRTDVGGRFYGSHVVLGYATTAGANNSAITVTASTVNNVLVLTIGNMAGGFASNAYSCTGFVKLT